MKLPSTAPTPWRRAMLRPSAGTRGRFPFRRQPPTIQPSSGHEKQKRPVNRAVFAPDEDARSSVPCGTPCQDKPVSLIRPDSLAASNDTSPPMPVPYPKIAILRQTKDPWRSIVAPTLHRSLQCLRSSPPSSKQSTHICNSAGSFAMMLFLTGHLTPSLTVA
ncbi:hypothetical protein LMH87_004428 [Akanthomyces muscarius]|uniref:Uncharacterized protein n=1 Tax=Akanthomyces muscarius TaxID=2231603 RepID=A0A9W8Q3Q8_AKAMU|nr:hypothetical protein LMH87_004428 [Akanthomyces muscarius]KAJ4145580.1 hypothetical protein LMH87_004428 [Akanthomyces muscarius]